MMVHNVDRYEKVVEFISTEYRRSTNARAIYAPAFTQHQQAFRLCKVLLLVD